MTETTSSPSDAHPRPLDGVRVLDLTRVLAGPYCTMILADLGAEVVKVERPAGGDDARQFGPFLPSGLSAYFASINRGKKSVVLDLRQPDDRETFLRLVERADALVENFRPGTMAGFGLPVERLRAVNPRLVYVSLSGFGHAGTETDRPAYDIVVQALSGLMSITGDGPGHFVRVGTSISDILTGMFGAIAVLSALRHRDVTGTGLVADLAMLDCTVTALENAVRRFAVTGRPPEPLGTRHPAFTPFQAFAARDGAIVVAAGNDALWRKLCDVLGCPDLADDPRLATNQARTENQPNLEERMNARFRLEPQAHWLDRLAKAGIPSAPIRNVAEVAADPHLASRQVFHEMHDEQGDRFLTVGSPLRMDGHPPPLSPRAPELGEHTESVLAEWLANESQ
jgi:CoA:oxalate CoA-transferase